MAVLQRKAHSMHMYNTLISVESEGQAGRPHLVQGAHHIHDSAPSFMHLVAVSRDRARWRR